MVSHVMRHAVRFRPAVRTGVLGACLAAIVAAADTGRPGRGAGAARRTRRTRLRLIRTRGGRRSMRRSNPGEPVCGRRQPLGAAPAFLVASVAAAVGRAAAGPALGERLARAGAGRKIDANRAARRVDTARARQHRRPHARRALSPDEPEHHLRRRRIGRDLEDRRQRHHLAADRRRAREHRGQCAGHRSKRTGRDVCRHRRRLLSRGDSQHRLAAARQRDLRDARRRTHMAAAAARPLQRTSTGSTISSSASATAGSSTPPREPASGDHGIAARAGRVLLETTVRGGCLDLAIRRDGGNDVLFASCGSYEQATIYRILTAESQPRIEVVLREPGQGRTSLAIAPSNPDVIYAIAASNDPGPARQLPPGTSRRVSLGARRRCRHVGDARLESGSARISTRCSLPTSRAATIQECGSTCAEQLHQHGLVHQRHRRRSARSESRLGGRRGLVPLGRRRRFVGTRVVDGCDAVGDADAGARRSARHRVSPGIRRRRRIRH